MKLYVRKYPWRPMIRHACMPSWQCGVVAGAWVAIWVFFLIGAGLLMAIENPRRRGNAAIALGQPELDFFDAIYFTEVYLTTCGFGDIIPVSTAGRVFVTVWSFFGTGLWLMFLSTLVSYLGDWLYVNVVLNASVHLRQAAVRRQQAREDQLEVEIRDDDADLEAALARGRGRDAYEDAVDVDVDVDENENEDVNEDDCDVASDEDGIERERGTVDKKNKTVDNKEDDGSDGSGEESEDGEGSEEGTRSDDVEMEEGRKFKEEGVDDDQDNRLTDVIESQGEEDEGDDSEMCATNNSNGNDVQEKNEAKNEEEGDEKEKAKATEKEKATAKPKKGSKERTGRDAITQWSDLVERSVEEDVLSWYALFVLNAAALVFYFGVHLLGAGVTFALEPDIGNLNDQGLTSNTFGNAFYLALLESQTICFGTDYNPKTSGGRLFFVVWHQFALISATFLFVTVALAILRWTKSRLFFVVEKLVRKSHGIASARRERGKTWPLPIRRKTKTKPEM